MSQRYFTPSAVRFFSNSREQRRAACPIAKPMKELVRHLVRLNLYLISEVWPFSWMVTFYGTNFSIIAIGMFYVIDFRRLF